MPPPADERELARRVSVHVRMLRSARQWSQEDLAQHCDLSHRVIQYAESAVGVPTLATLCRLARGLGVDVRALLAPARRLAPRKAGRPPKAGRARQVSRAKKP